VLRRTVASLCCGEESRSSTYVEIQVSNVMRVGHVHGLDEPAQCVSHEDRRGSFVLLLCRSTHTKAGGTKKVTVDGKAIDRVKLDTSEVAPGGIPTKLGPSPPWPTSRYPPCGARWTNDSHGRSSSRFARRKARLNDNLDPSIVCAPFRRCIVSNRSGQTKTLCCNSIG